MLNVGEQAPNFEIMSTDQKNVCLQDFRGSKVLLFFLKNIHNRKFQTLNIYATVDDSYKEYQSLNTIPICICFNHPTTICPYFENITMYTPLLYDAQFEIARNYDVETSCITFGKTYQVINECAYIIDENGYIEKQYRKFNCVHGSNTALAYLKKKQHKQHG